MKKLINILLAVPFLLFFISCNREASIIPPSQVNTSIIPSSPGTENIEIKAIYPSDESTNVSRTAPIIVVFSKSVNTSTVVANTNISLSGVTLNSPSFSGGNAIDGYTIATFTHSGLANNTAYTVTVGTGIAGFNGEAFTAYVDPTLPTGHHFTTIDSDAAATNAVPVVLTLTRYPASGATSVSKSLDYVQLTFSEEMDISTIGFNVTNATGGTVTTTDNRTFYLPLTGVDYADIITITLRSTSPYIPTSLAGVAATDYSNYSWSFTIESDPSISTSMAIGSIWVTNVTSAGARVYWTTTIDASSSSVYYGTSSFFSSSLSEAATTNTLHYVDLTGLSVATKYYFQAMSDSVSSSTGYFITKGDGSTGYNTRLSTESGDKTELNAVRNTGTTGTYDGSSFVTWVNGSNLKAAYFNNDTSGTLQWGGIDGSVLDSHSRTNPRAFTDSRSSLLVTMEDGTNIYVKRVYNSGGTMTFAGYDFGSSAASTGLQLTNPGSNPRIAIVYANPTNVNADGASITSIRSGTAVVLPAGNWFYDFDTDFSSTTPVVSVGDVLLDVTNSQTITTVTVNSSSYRHALCQNSAVIAAGEFYVIGNHLVTGTFTATNHTLFSAGAYSNGTNILYTEHSYSMFGSISANDIVYNNTTSLGGRYVSSAQINNITALESGSANANRTNHLIDGQSDFSSVSGLNTTTGYARNIDASSASRNYYSKITAITTTDLTLSSDIFPDGDEAYELVSIQSLVAWGTATSGTTGATLEDTGSYFSGGVSAGNIVVNTTTSQITYISSVGDNTLTLADSIFSSGDSYQIYTGSSLGTGTAGAVKTNHLIDGGAVSGSLGSTGFNALSFTNAAYVVNTANQLYSPITAFSEVDLTLTYDIFTATGQSYNIVDINTGSTLASGTNSSVLANYLVDTANDFSAISTGSYVLNTTDGTLATVTTVYAHILGLDDNIFVSGNGYSLRTGSAQLATGPVDSISGSQITDSTTAGLDFNTAGLVIGSAYARNTSTSEITQVVSIISANTISVTDSSIFTAGSSNYEVFNITGAATTGTADGTGASQLIDSTANFISIATGTNSYAVRTTPTPMRATRINNVIATMIYLSNNIFTATSKNYVIYAGTSPYTGGVSSVRDKYLVDAGFDFTGVGSLGVGDYVRNTSTNKFALVASFPPTVTDKDQLELDTHIFTLNNQGYELIDKGTLVMSGQNTGSTANQISDNVYFPGILVAANYVVINTSASPNKIARISSIAANTLTLDASIFTAGGGESYQVYTGSLLHSGTANAKKSGHLVDGSKTGWGASYAGYLVENLATTSYTTVTSAIPTDLTLVSDIFTLGSEGYSIFNEYCTTHFVSDALHSFYRFTLNAADPLGTVSGDTITIYDSIVTGTADTTPTYPLYDNTLALNFTTLTALNDYVFSYTSGAFSWVNVAPSHARAIDLYSNLFSVAGTYGYKIFRTSPYISSSSIVANGIVTSASGYQMNDTGASFTATVEKGDLVYNVTDSTYAVVVSVTATQLTLNKDTAYTSFSVSDGYIVIKTTDRLTETGINTTSGTTLTDANADFTNVRIGDIVRNNNSGAQTTVTAKTATTLTLASAATFGSTGIRYVVLQPRVFVAFEHIVDVNTTNIIGELLRLSDGSNCGITIDIYNQSSSKASDIQTASDTSGNAFVLYEVGVLIYGKRFNAVGTDLDGYASTSPGNNLATGDLIKILPDGSGGIYILYEYLGTVYLQRRSSTFTDLWGGAKTVATNATDSVMTLDSSNRPMIAYAGTANGNIRITRYSTGGGIDYSAMPINMLSVNSYGTYYINADDHKSNIEIVPNNSDGAIVAWIDTRYMASVGFTIHALAVDGSGNPETTWDADSSGSATDYNGVKIGILGTDITSDISFKAVNINDGSTPWSPRFIWQDYRTVTQSDLYYQDFSY